MSVVSILGNTGKTVGKTPRMALLDALDYIDKHPCTKAFVILLDDSDENYSVATKVSEMKQSDAVALLAFEHAAVLKQMGAYE